MDVRDRLLIGALGFTGYRLLPDAALQPAAPLHACMTFLVPLCYFTMAISCDGYRSQKRADAGLPDDSGGGDAVPAPPSPHAHAGGGRHGNVNGCAP